MGICFIWLACLAVASANPPVQIPRIIDGDTVAARIDGKGKEIIIRLEAIDAPEKKQDFSNICKKALGGFLKGKKLSSPVENATRQQRSCSPCYRKWLGLNERTYLSGSSQVWKKLDAKGASSADPKGRVTPKKVCVLSPRTSYAA